MDRTRYNIFVAAYNTRLIAGSTLPKGYDDLVDPRWKGRLRDRGRRQRLVRRGGRSARRGARPKNCSATSVASNGVSVRKGHTLLANLVVSGEVPLAIFELFLQSGAMKDRGAPIDSLAIAPVGARFEGAGVARRAPHPYAAVLFLEFMLTEAQDILAKRDFFPADVRVKPMPTGLTFLDPAKALDQSQKWSKVLPRYRDPSGAIRA